MPLAQLFDRREIERRLSDPDATIRAWTIQLATEQGSPARAVLARFAELAKSDPSPRVRLYLASRSERLPLEERWDIIAPLLRHSEDAADPNLPLMEWYAAEPLAALDAARAAGLAAAARLPRIQEFMARRIGALGTAESVALLVDELGARRSSEQRLALLLGMEEGLRGRRQVAMPPAWPDVFRALAADADPQVRSRAVGLGVTFGDAAARATLRSLLADTAAGLPARREALAALLKVKEPSLASQLRALVLDPGLGSQAIRGLAAFDDPATPDVLIAAYRSLKPSERRDVLNALAARSGSARAMLGAVATGRLPRGDLTADLVRQLGNLKDTAVDALIGRLWGTVRATTGDRGDGGSPNSRRCSRLRPHASPRPRWDGPSSPRSVSSATPSSTPVAKSAPISPAPTAPISTTFCPMCSTQAR